jgi:hypothetical protein
MEYEFQNPICGMLNGVCTDVARGEIERLTDNITGSGYRGQG